MDMENDRNDAAGKVQDGGRTAQEIVRDALDGWDDGSGAGEVVDPYQIGGGGEGWAFVAQRLHVDAKLGSVCTSYVVVKFPILTEENQPPQVDDRRVQRLRAEYDRRRRLGDAPHLGRVPALRFLPRDRLRVPASGAAITLGTTEKAIPVLVTPLQVTRTGGAVPADLQSLIPDDGCWSSRELLNWTVIARGLARALWSMHGRGWAHNDIKPHNVVLYENHGTWHEVNLIDFGNVEPDMPATVLGGAMGTPSYWRPERLEVTLRIKREEKLAHLRPSTEDLYALGVMLAEVLLGQKEVKSLRQAAAAAARKAEEDVVAAAMKEGDAAAAAARKEAEAARPARKALSYATSIRRRVIQEIMGPSRTGPESLPRVPSGTERIASGGSPRSVAFLLCQSFLMREPPAELLADPTVERPTLGLLRDFLTNVDMRIVALGDPQTTATRLLVNIGASPSASTLKVHRQRYYSFPRGAAPEQIRPLPISRCAEVVRDGYVRYGILITRARLDELRTSGAVSMQDVYEITWGLRLLAGVLLPRDRRYKDAWRALERWRAKLDSFSTERDSQGNASPREVLAWWIDCLQWRLWRAHHRDRRSGYICDGGQLLPDVEPPDRPLAKPPAPIGDPTENARAIAWAHEDTVTRAMMGEIVLPDDSDAPKQADSYQQSGKSTQEAVHALLQKVRWMLHRLRTTEPGRLSDMFRDVSPSPSDDSKSGEPDVGAFAEMLRMWTLAVGWSLVTDLHHEYASAMLVVAHQGERLFGAGTLASKGREARRNASPTDAVEAGKTPVPGQRGNGGTAADPPPSAGDGTAGEEMSFVREALEQRLREMYGVDAETVLSTAAECALAAAATYAKIDAPLLAWRAMQTAARCLSACEAPGLRVDAVRWLQFAKNDYLLHRVTASERPILNEKHIQDPDEASELDRTGRAERKRELRRQILRASSQNIGAAIQQWADRAAKVYKNTAGSDPGAFLSQAMFGRYGAALEALTAGSLGVEAARISSAEPRDDQGPVEPHSGEAISRMLDPVRDEMQRSPAKPQGFTMLEVECGLGHDCAAEGENGIVSLLPRATEVWGIDSMPWCVRKAKARCAGMDRVQIVKANILASDDVWEREVREKLGGRRFDVLWMHDVLVRVSNRHKVMDRAIDLLVPGGHLLMTAWAQTGPMSHEEWRELCDVAWITGPETEEGLEEILESVRFQSIKITDHRPDMSNAFAWAKQAPGRLQASGDAMNGDLATALRGEHGFSVLHRLVDEKKLGWVWITARRPHPGSAADGAPR